MVHSRRQFHPYPGKSAICEEWCITLNALNWHLINIFSKLSEMDRFSASFRFFNQYPEYRSLVDEFIAQACNSTGF